MSNSSPNLPMNSEEASKLQMNYVKSRLAWQLATQISASIPGALINLVNSSLKTCTWSDEELVSIGKIVIVLDGIRELQQQLENLSQQLIDTYKRPNSSPPTSTHDQTTTDGGDAITSKLESLL